MAAEQQEQKPNLKRQRIHDKKKLDPDKTYMSKTEYAKHRGIKVSILNDHLPKLKEAITMVGKREKFDVDLADFILDGGNAHTNYAESKAKREHFKALEAELDFKKKQGTLLDAEQVEKEAFEIARVTRDRLLTIPDRVSQQLSVEKSSHRCYELLMKEITDALETIANA